ncbi:MAG: DHHA1 domain-containing protein, partial [Akkermansiaceae bacterium]|nr:DHHA1 domain-containing protein [Akkermansiaceae bacterium]
QITAIEEKVNASISAGDLVSWIEVPHTEVKDNKDIMQFFGDKYGDLVRVVQIGGGDKTLDGYSMELCGGTHVTNTKDIGLFKIKSEGAIASGVRRIEAVCGQSAWNWLSELAGKATIEEESLRTKLGQANVKLTEAGQDAVEHAEFPRIMGALLTEGGDFHQINSTIQGYQKHLASLREASIGAEKKVKKAQAAGAARMADSLLAESNLTGNIVISTEGPAALLQELLNGLKKVHFTHAAFFIVDDGDKLHLGALCGEDGNNAGHGAGNLIKDLAPIAGGKGGGKPDMARGAAGERDNANKLQAAAEAKLK